MLHEMRHVLETSDATHNGSAAAENEAIVAHCMPGAGQEPNPTYIREGGEVFHPANDDDWYWYAEEFAY